MKGTSSHDFGEAFLATYIVVVVDDIQDAVPNHVGDIHADTLTHEGVVALFVDDRALLVHHVVVFEEAFTDAEVILLDLLLCAFDGVVYHLRLYHLAVLESQFVHNVGDALGGEEAHKVVLERNEEY